MVLDYTSDLCNNINLATLIFTCFSIGIALWLAASDLLHKHLGDPMLLITKLMMKYAAFTQYFM